MAQDRKIQEENVPDNTEEDAGTKTRKLNKSEKKCRKALLKMGLKSMQGITRISVKRKDGLIFVINEPEIFKSPTSENSYVVLGEM